MPTVSFFAVVARGRYWKSARFVRARVRKPALKESQICVRIELQLPDDWENPPVIPVAVTHPQINRPIIAKSINP